MARRREKIFKKISTHTKISLKLKKITKKDNHENIFKKQTNKTKPKTPLKKKLHKILDCEEKEDTCWSYQAMIDDSVSD